MNAQFPNAQDEAQLAGGPFQVEIRGYEVARWDDATERWVQVAAYRANALGRAEATRSAQWLNERHQWAYRCRAIISLDHELVADHAKETTNKLSEDEQLEVARKIMDERHEALALLSD